VSAWLVDKVHIDLIVGATEAGADPEVATGVGRMLWLENLRSVAYRYPNDESGSRPGPIGLTDVDVANYTYTEQPYRLTASQLKCALHCLNYQSCECNDYDESEAKAFIDRELPEVPTPPYGTEEAGPWGWTQADVNQRASRLSQTQGL
jgi:hypothetical protein